MKFRTKVSIFVDMKLPPSPTYYTCLEMYSKALQENGITAELTMEMTASGEWARAGTGKRTTQIRGNVVVVEKGLLGSLSTNAVKMAIVMMDDLKMNNALWYHESESSHDRVAMKELRDKGIIIRTEDPKIHFINPMRIRRGSAAGVLAQTAELLSSMSRVHKDLIKDLNFKSVKFNQFDQLNLPFNGSNVQKDL